MHKSNRRAVANGRKGQPNSTETVIRVGLKKVLPVVVTEMSDMFERRPPRMTKRDKRQMESAMDDYLGKSVPLINDLEVLHGDPLRMAEAYDKVELLFRTWMDAAEIKIRGKDSLDGYLQVFKKYVRLPPEARRITHFRRVYQGLQRLIEASVADPQKEKDSNELIQEFGRHHRRQYTRYHHAFEARQRSNRDVGFSRMTKRNITVLSEEYRDGAAALEKRLQLLIGLHHIAKGSTKKYGDLRKFGLRNLCEQIESPKNPELHFLKHCVDPTVRNTLAHDGADPSFSKSRIDFRSRSQTVSWTLSQFLKNTLRLVQTIMALTYLESLFAYVTLEKAVARFRHQVQLANELDVLVRQGQPQR